MAKGLETRILELKRQAHLLASEVRGLPGGPFAFDHHDLAYELNHAAISCGRVAARVGRLAELADEPAKRPERKTT